MLVSIRDKSGNCSRQRATVLLEPPLSIQLLAEIWKWHFSKGPLASESMEFSLWKAIKTNGKKVKITSKFSYTLGYYFLCKELFISLPGSLCMRTRNPLYKSEKIHQKMKLCIFGRLNPRSWMWATLTVNLIVWNCLHKHSISGGSWVSIEYHSLFLHISPTSCKVTKAGQTSTEER